MRCHRSLIERFRDPLSRSLPTPAVPFHARRPLPYPPNGEPGAQNRRVHQFPLSEKEANVDNDEIHN